MFTEKTCTRRRTACSSTCRARCTQLTTLHTFGFAHAVLTGHCRFAWPTASLPHPVLANQARGAWHTASLPHPVLTNQARGAQHAGFFHAVRTVRRRVALPTASPPLPVDAKQATVAQGAVALDLAVFTQPTPATLLAVFLLLPVLLAQSPTVAFHAQDLVHAVPAHASPATWHAAGLVPAVCTERRRRLAHPTLCRAHAVNTGRKGTLSALPRESPVVAASATPAWFAVPPLNAVFAYPASFALLTG